MKEKVNCPICRKRIFDISSTVEGDVLVEMKCQHCKNIIHVKHRMYGIQKEGIKKEIAIS